MFHNKEKKTKKKEKLLKESYSLLSTLSTFPVPDSYGNKYFQQNIDSLRKRLAEVLNICE